MDLGDKPKHVALQLKCVPVHLFFTSCLHEEKGVYNPIGGVHLFNFHVIRTKSLRSGKVYSSDLGVFPRAVNTSMWQYLLSFIVVVIFDRTGKL